MFVRFGLFCCIILFVLAVFVACQTPTLTPHLRPCQTSAECDGADCNQGLCGSAQTESSPHEPSVEQTPSEFPTDTQETAVEIAPTDASEPPTEQPTPENTEEITDASEPAPETPPEPFEFIVSEDPLEAECTDGQTRVCFSGGSLPPKAPCKSGTQTCENGKWADACVGEITPTPEECDNIDNDCNGQIDDKLQKACNSECGSGQQICKAGNWGACDAPAPQTEICNNKDDDCDGKIDGITRDCEQKGVCKGSFETCNNGQWSGCDYKNIPEYLAPEINKCDGLDNDCNGQIDDGCSCQDGSSRPCYTGTKGCLFQNGIYTCKAPCQAGTQICRNGQWGPCDSQITNTPERCDGTDNDCDGQIDNNLPIPQPCPKQIGVCQGARYTCKEGKLNCDYGTNYEDVESKCDGKDNDCDGQIDETCVCTPGQQRACYPAKPGCVLAGGLFSCKGACSPGKQTCNPDGKAWGMCIDAIIPAPELCDTIDNDCNGTVDNIAPRECHARIKMGSLFACYRGTMQCASGQELCKSTFILACTNAAGCSGCPLHNGKGPGCLNGPEEGGKFCIYQ